MKRLNFLLILILPFFAEAQDPAPAHEGQVTAIAFTKDKTYVLTGGADQRIRLWNSHSGKMLQVIECGMIPEKIFVNPDGSTFIASGPYKKHIIFRLPSGEPVGEIDVDKVLGFTPDGSRIITAVYGEDGLRRYASLGFAQPDEAFDTRYFSQSRVYFKDHLKNPQISRDGKHIYMPVEENKVLMFKEDDPFGEEEIRLPVPAEQIAIHGSDSILAVAGSEAIVEMSRFRKSRELQRATLSGPEAELWFSGSGLYLISKNNNEMLVYKVTDGSLVGSYRFENAEVLSADDEGIRVAYSGENGVVILENLISGREKRFLEAPDIIEKWGFQDYLRGVYFYRKGKYRKALSYFQACEGKSPRISKLYLLRGECYFKTGNLQQAVMDFLTDHEAAPGRSSIHLARVFAWKGYPDEAVKWLDTNRFSPFKVSLEMIRKDDYLKELFRESGLSSYLLQNWQTEGEKMLAESLKREENKELLAALEYLDKAIMLEPENPLLYNKRAGLYIKMHEMDKARKDFMKQAELNPYAKAESFKGVALTYSRSSEYFNAVIWIKKSIQEDASYTEHLIDIAEIYHAGYRRDLAIGTLNEYLDLMPEDYYAYYLRATLHVLPEGRLADIAKAIELCKEQGEPIPAEFYEVLEEAQAETRK